MKKTRTFLLLSVLVAVLVLGIAYAAITDVTLTVNAEAVASADQSNFVVKFTGTPVVKPTEGSNGSGTLVIDDDLTAIMNVSGFKKIGDRVQATIEILNDSTDLGATLAATPSAIAEKMNGQALGSSEYFKIVKTELSTTNLAAKGTATLTIEVELIKVPIAGDVTGTFNVSVVASPVN